MRTSLGFVGRCHARSTADRRVSTPSVIPVPVIASTSRLGTPATISPAMARAACGQVVDEEQACLQVAVESQHVDRIRGPENLGLAVPPGVVPDR